MELQGRTRLLLDLKFELVFWLDQQLQEQMYFGMAFLKGQLLQEQMYFGMAFLKDQQLLEQMYFGMVFLKDQQLDLGLGLVQMSKERAVYLDLV